MHFAQLHAAYNSPLLPFSYTEEIPQFLQHRLLVLNTDHRSDYLVVLTLCWPKFPTPQTTRYRQASSFDKYRELHHLRVVVICASQNEKKLDSQCGKVVNYMIRDLEDRALKLVGAR